MTKTAQKTIEKSKPTWRTVRLGDVADIQWGDTNTTKAAYRPNGYKTFSATGPDGYMDHYDFDREGVVLSAIGANCGETWFANGKWSCIKNTIRFWGEDGEADTLFLYYKTHNKNLWPQRGSAQPFIAQGDARAMEIAIPADVSEQKQIARIPAAFDEKIENNNHIIKTLEEMAQAIFKNVTRSLNGERRTIGEIAAVVLGGTPSRVNTGYWNGNIPWINSGEVNKLRVIEPSEYITENGLKNSNARLMPKGTTLIAITGATLGQVSLLEIEASANQSVVGVYDEKGRLGEYLYLYIKNNIKDIISHAAGGAQQHINKGIIDAYPIIVPSDLSEFISSTRPIFSEISNLLKENQKLAAMRDLLLPRLMSGEIRV